VTVKSLKGTPPSWFSIKVRCRHTKTFTFHRNVCFTSPPECRPHFRTRTNPLHNMLTFVSNPLHRHRICCHMLAVASMSLRICCTAIVYAHFRFKSAAQASHLPTFASNPVHKHRIFKLSLQCRFRSAFACHSKSEHGGLGEALLDMSKRLKVR